MIFKEFQTKTVWNPKHTVEETNVKPAPATAADTACRAEARELAQLFAQVAVGLKRAHVEAPTELVEAAQRGGLGPRHATAILVLAFEDRLSVSEIAQRIGLSLPTTSQLVGELSRAGLVERSEDEHDRRRTIVRVADVHRRSIQALLERHIAPMERTLARLSPEARAVLLEGFRILREEVGPPAG